jgi:hypothetical protein
MPTPAFPRSLFAIAPFRVPDLGSFCFVQVLCSQLPNAKKWVRFVIFAEAPHATTTASGSGSFRHIGHRRPAPVHLPPSSAGGWVPVLYNELVRQGQTQGDLAPARFHFYDHQNSSTPTRKHASPATAAVDRQRQIGFVSHRRPDRLPGPQIGFVPSYSSTAPLASHPQPSHPAGRVWVRSNHSNSLVPSGSTSELGSLRHVPKPRYTPPRHPQIGFVPSKSCPTPELPVLPLLPQ